MNSICFPQMQYVNVKVKGIEWDTTDDDGEPISCPELPLGFDSYEVELDENIDINTKEGFDILCENLVDQLSCEYDFCVNGIDEIEILAS